MSAATGAWRVSYTPGRWLVLTGPTAVVILQPASPQWSELVATIWEDVLHAASLPELAAGMSAFRLDEMPSFGAFYWSADGMRSLLRGDITARDADSGDVVGSGAGVVTWNEVGLGSLSRVRLQLGPDVGEPELVLPLVTGVVTAGSLLLDCSPAARVTTPQQPGRPAATPEPAPVALAAPGPVEPLAPPEPEPAAPDQEPASSGPVLADDEDGPDFPPIGDEDDDEDDDTAFDLPVIDPTAPMPVTASAPVTAPAPVGGAGVAVGPVDALGSGRPATEASAEEAGPADDLAEYGRTVFASTLPGLPQHADRTVPRPTAPARPVVARLVVSDGERAEVDRPVLVGRAPTVTRVSGTQLPTLLTVASPSHDISRTHLEFAPREGRLVVTDLHSTNGTVLIAPGAAPVDLEPGQAVEVTPGSLIDLGDGVTITVESM